MLNVDDCWTFDFNACVGGGAVCRMFHTSKEEMYESFGNIGTQAVERIDSMNKMKRQTSTR